MPSTLQPSSSPSSSYAVLDSATSNIEDKGAKGEDDTFWTAIERITKDMEPYIPASEVRGGVGFQGERVCNLFRNEYNRSNPDAILVVNPCLYRKGAKCHRDLEGVAGTGNLVVAHVALRLGLLAEGSAAYVKAVNSDVDIHSLKRKDVMPWLSGYFPASSTFDRSHPPFDMALPTEYCPDNNKDKDGDDNKSHKPQNRLRSLQRQLQENEQRRLSGNGMPMKFMKPLISYDLQRMAIALVGTPKEDNPNHPSIEFETKYLRKEASQPRFAPVEATGGNIYQIPIHDYFENGPVYPNIELDDVVIHYRCGDILNFGPGPFYFPKFEEYTKLISPEAQSVGIITQPFSKDDEDVDFRTRDKLDVTGPRCKVLVEGLVQYILEHCPNIANSKKGGVRIHNGANETVPLAYARMIMANQTLAIFPSTFSSIPATMAPFGTGYVTKPRKGGMKGSFANYWLTNDMTQDLYPNQPVEVDIYNNMLYAPHLVKQFEYGDEFVLEWFRDPSIPPGERSPPTLEP